MRRADDERPPLGELVGDVLGHYVVTAICADRCGRRECKRRYRGAWLGCDGRWNPRAGEMERPR